MFPIVLLIALSGVVVGMLNSFGHFSVPALAPLAWNVVIIVALVGLVPVFPEEDEIYAYAIGVLAGTIVQLVAADAVAARARWPFRARRSTGATRTSYASSS